MLDEENKEHDSVASRYVCVCVCVCVCWCGTLRASLSAVTFKRKAMQICSFIWGLSTADAPASRGVAALLRIAVNLLGSDFFKSLEGRSSDRTAPHCSWVIKGIVSTDNCNASHFLLSTQTHKLFSSFNALTLHSSCSWNYSVELGMI